MSARADAEITGNSLSFSQQVLFRNIGIEKKSIAAAIAGAHLKGPRGSFLHVHRQIDGIRLISFFRGELYVLEVAGSLQRVAALRDLCARKKFLFVCE